MAESIKKLYRSVNNRIVAGISAGLADYCNIDVTVIRVLFCILGVFGGSGLVIYLIMWLLVPNEDSAQPIGEDTIKENIHEVQKEVTHRTQQVADKIKEMTKSKTEK